jgi:NADH:ubiquinone oxidoreductase subunit 3 (subunit A)
MLELLNSWIGIVGIVLVIFMIVAPTVHLKHVIKKSENNQNAKNPSDL